MEKLRKQLQREEKRVARAELRAQQSDVVNAGVAESLFNSGGIPGTSKKRKRSLSPKTLTAVASVQKSAEDPNGLDPNKSNVSETLLPQGIHDASEQKQQNALNPLRDPLTPTSQPCTPYGNTIPSLKLSNEVALSREIPETPQTHMSGDRNNPSIHSTVSMLDSTSDSSSTDSDDLTSSSGSSSDDDDKSDDDAPEQSTSKRTEPEKVRAPKRTQPKQVCRAFLRTGRCKYGTRCRNLHELPKRGNQSVRAKTKDHEKQQGRKGRIGLYQRVSGSLNVNWTVLANGPSRSLFNRKKNRRSERGWLRLSSWERRRFQIHQARKIRVVLLLPETSVGVTLPRSLYKGCLRLACIGATVHTHFELRYPMIAVPLMTVRTNG